MRISYHDATESRRSTLPTPQWYRGTILLSFLLLIPILTFPAGADQSIYAVGGKMLLKGMTYYRDIGELKPPFIHVIYGVAESVFGDGILGVRIVELLAQWLTLAFMIRLVNRHLNDLRITAIAAIVYALLYVALGPDGTGQPESYVGLFFFPACQLLLGKRRKSRLMGAGVLGGMLVLVKYSMILLPVLFVFSPFLFLNANRAAKRREALLIALGVAIPGLCYLGWLLLGGSFPGFELVNQFLVARQRGALRGGGVMERLQGLGLWFGFSFGIATTILLAHGLWRTTYARVEVEGGGARDRFFRLMGLSVLALFAGAVAEIMMLPYQFSRIYPPASIFLAWVLLIGVSQWKQRGQRSIRLPYSNLMNLALVVIGLVLSPVPRYFLETWRGVGWRFSAEAEGNPWFHADLTVLQELRDVGDTIRAQRGEKDQLVVVSGYAGHLYCYTGVLPIFSSLHGHQVIAGFGPKLWKDELRTVLAERHPMFVVIERNDEAAARFVEAPATDRAVAGIPGVSEVLRQEYDTLMTRPSFVLYRRLGEGKSKK